MTVAASTGGRPVTVLELQARALDVAIDGSPVLRGVDLLARAGTWLTVTGPSGSGKSVLLQVLAGARQPDRGQVLIDDRAWRKTDPPPGVVQQGYGLVPVHTAAETVALPMLARGVARDDVGARTSAWLGALGLTATADQLVSHLSGGQRQRVAIARALGMESPVLLFDEPTAEQDEANRDRVLGLLRERVEAGAILVVVSHDPAIIEAGDEVFALTADGRVAA